MQNKNCFLVLEITDVYGDKTDGSQTQLITFSEFDVE